jgi:hypothetical protein
MNNNTEGLEIVNADIYNGKSGVEGLDEEEEVLNDATISRLACRNLRTEVAEENINNLFKALTVMEVLGCESSAHGCACEQHLCCGRWVRKGDKLVCKWEHQEINEMYDEEEEDVQVFSLNSEGYHGCHVGYIPRHRFLKYGANRFDLMYLKVIDDYRFDENNAIRQRSYKNNGMVNCEIIKDDFNYVGRNPFEGEACEVSIN